MSCFDVGRNLYLVENVDRQVMGKFFNIAVTLTFIVGQVQYAYTAYFCNMKNVYVNSIKTECEVTMSATDQNGHDVNTDSSCEAKGDSSIPSYQGSFAQKITSSNCCSFKVISKNVVDNFTDFTNHLIILIPANPFAGSAFLTTTDFTPLTVQTIQPSPPNIITLEKNFRI